MGADLCGYILIGPKKLDPNKIKKAKDHIAKLDHKIKVIQNCTNDNEQRIMIEQFNKKVNFDDYEFFEEKLGEEGSKSFVDDFVKMWNAGEAEAMTTYRDMISRPEPFRKDYKIVVAGETTWGDGPDPDSAWGLIELADRCNVLKILGIK